MLKVYMDESGTHGGSPVVTVGAYIAKPSQWQAWQREWNRLKKPIQVVHAADCANQDGEFKDWDQPERFAFAAKIIPVIPKHIPMGVAIGINLRAFDKAMKSTAITSASHFSMSRTTTKRKQQKRLGGSGSIGQRNVGPSG
jgi:hypothetical protein